MNPHLKHSIIIFTATALISWAYVAWGGNMTLIKVEKLTEAEQTEIAEAEKDVRVAEGYLKILKMRTAGNHGCTEENYMEWETSVKFDGEYILFYRTDLLKQVLTPSNTGTTIVGIPSELYIKDSHPKTLRGKMKFPGKGEEPNCRYPYTYFKP